MPITHDLEPVPKRGLRIGMMLGLWALAFLGSTPWSAKVGFAVGSWLIFGTYRRFRLTPSSLMQRWTVGYIDQKHQSYKFRRFSFLEVKYEAPTGILELLMFGGFGFLYGWIVDRCFPWVGGAYQIWLNNEADQRVLAWQGNSQANYRQNLELMESVTGLRAQMR